MHSNLAAQSNNQYDARDARAAECLKRVEVKSTQAAQPALSEMIGRVANATDIVEGLAQRARAVADSVFGPVPEAESLGDSGPGAGRLGAFYGTAERLSVAIVDLERQIRRLETL